MTGKVLIVDDNADARLMLSEALAYLGIAHSTVKSAGACISRLVVDPGEFDLVLMDIHMPALSGADASQWIKASEVPRHRRLPIIAVTGDAAFADPAAWPAYGITDVLRKPFSLDSLRAVLRKHLAQMRPN